MPHTLSISVQGTAFTQLSPSYLTSSVVQYQNEPWSELFSRIEAHVLSMFEISTEKRNEYQVFVKVPFSDNGLVFLSAYSKPTQEQRFAPVFYVQIWNKWDLTSPSHTFLCGSRHSSASLTVSLQVSNPEALNHSQVGRVDHITARLATEQCIDAFRKSLADLVRRQIGLSDAQQIGLTYEKPTASQPHPEQSSTVDKSKQNFITTVYDCLHSKRPMMLTVNIKPKVSGGQKTVSDSTPKAVSKATPANVHSCTSSAKDAASATCAAVGVVAGQTAESSKARQSLSESLDNGPNRVHCVSGDKKSTSGSHPGLFLFSSRLSGSASFPSTASSSGAASSKPLPSATDSKAANPYLVQFDPAIMMPPKPAVVDQQYRDEMMAKLYQILNPAGQPSNVGQNETREKGKASVEAHTQQAPNNATQPTQQMDDKRAPPSGTATHTDNVLVAVKDTKPSTPTKKTDSAGACRLVQNLLNEFLVNLNKTLSETFGDEIGPIAIQPAVTSHPPETPSETEIQTQTETKAKTKKWTRKKRNKKEAKENPCLPDSPPDSPPDSSKTETETEIKAETETEGKRENSKPEAKETPCPPDSSLDSSKTETEGEKTSSKPEAEETPCLPDSSPGSSKPRKQAKAKRSKAGAKKKPCPPDPSPDCPKAEKEGEKESSKAETKENPCPPVVCQPTSALQSTAAANRVKHNARCDVCEFEIYGIRYKCLDCPDWDCCDQCRPLLDETQSHPGHRRFIVAKEPDIISGPSPYHQPTHPDIYCDDCDKPIKGIRYNCIACPDFDLCQDCEADPLNQHEVEHGFKHVFVKLRKPLPSGQQLYPHLNTWQPSRGSTFSSKKAASQVRVKVSALRSSASASASATAAPASTFTPASSTSASASTPAPVSEKPASTCGSTMASSSAATATAAAPCPTCASAQKPEKLSKSVSTNQEEIDRPAEITHDADLERKLTLKSQTNNQEEAKPSPPTALSSSSDAGPSSVQTTSSSRLGGRTKLAPIDRKVLRAIARSLIAATIEEGAKGGKKHTEDDDEEDGGKGRSMKSSRLASTGPTKKTKVMDSELERKKGNEIEFEGPRTWHPSFLGEELELATQKAGELIAKIKAINEASVVETVGYAATEKEENKQDAGGVDGHANAHRLARQEASLPEPSPSSREEQEEKQAHEHSKDVVNKAVTASRKEPVRDRAEPNMANKEAGPSDKRAQTAAKWPRYSASATVAKSTHLDAAFVRNVSFADGTVVAAGSRFDKVWLVRNTGPQPWPSNVGLCLLAQIGGTLLTGGAKSEMGDNYLSLTDVLGGQCIAPGQQVEIRAKNLVAPEKDAHVKCFYKLAVLQGPDHMPQHFRKVQTFGEQLWIDVQVVEPSSSGELVSSDCATTAAVAVGDGSTTHAADCPSLCGSSLFHAPKAPESNVSSTTGDVVDQQAALSAVNGYETAAPLSVAFPPIARQATIETVMDAFRLRKDPPPRERDGPEMPSSRSSVEIRPHQVTDDTASIPPSPTSDEHETHSEVGELFSPESQAVSTLSGSSHDGLFDDQDSISHTSLEYEEEREEEDGFELVNQPSGSELDTDSEVDSRW